MNQTLSLTVSDLRDALVAIQERRARLLKLAKTLSVRNQPGPQAPRTAAAAEARQEAEHLAEIELRFEAAIEALS